MATLKQALSEYVAGCFTGIWVETQEPQEAISDLETLCRDESWQFGRWDIDQGLRVGGQAVEDGSDPLSAVKAAEAMGEGTSILVLENFHRFLSSAEVVQALVGQLHLGKQSRSIIVVLAPVLDLPPELEKLFVAVEHALPDREQLREIAESIGVEEGELPTGAELHQLTDAASGLTRGEAESAYSLSLVRHGRITAETIWELKTQTLKKSGLMELYQGNASFADLGGLDALKSFCKRALTRSSDRVRAKGVMLLSPPGCGKTQICKALGNETGRPVILLDVGSLMGSLVGQTESRTRQALKIIDAMGKTVVLLDEVDKAFGGATGGGSGDSGVSARMFGTFLTWLNDRTSDSFVVCTANDVQKLPPEFARAERFDSVFFVDLPGDGEKEAIWSQYIAMYELEPGQAKPKDQAWTGAEIKACCRLAALLDIPLKHAAQNVVPVAVTAHESIERLRSWASGRCIDAHHGGTFKITKSKPRTRRKIKADPSLN
ncbi:AAA family ATPase [Mariniblastus sp.]|nr:AAA family ATPase [Mariniblastus sp.]